MPDPRLSSSDAFTLECHMRGVSCDVGPLPSIEIAGLGLHPADGRMSLPVLTVDTALLDHSIDTMAQLARGHQALLAPHFKTPMSPALARHFARAGVWGFSAADLRQAYVLLAAGFRRIVIANQIGGEKAASRLAALGTEYPDAELYLFADSAAGVRSLINVWRSRSNLPPLKLLLEVGCGRAGVQSDEQLRELLSVFADRPEPAVALAGVAAYEGTAMREDFAETDALVSDLFTRIGYTLTELRLQVGPDVPLLLSAGGSSLFDLVISKSRPLLEKDGNTTLMLRSGSGYFGDHGRIAARMERLVARDLLGPEWSARISASFKPAMRLWAEILSRPSPDLAICGLGMRDAPHDQGNPVPLWAWRDGRPAIALEGKSRVSKFNDQHGFVTLAEPLDLRIGDVVEFGIRHPCTTIDQHAVIYGLGPDGRITDAFKTFFG